MKNKSISDFVAASMDSVLNSDQHKALFKSQYKFASSSSSSSSSSDVHHADMCEKCSASKESCKCGKSDSSLAWDSDDKHMAKDKACDKCGAMDQDECYCYADDHMDSHSAKSNALSASSNKTAALDIAIDSLLTASAALDAVGIDDASTVSLKLASLIVQAKKEMSAADKKKLKQKLQKGKKGKKPASSSSSSSSSSKPSASKSSVSKSTKVSKAQDMASSVKNFEYTASFKFPQPQDADTLQYAEKDIRAACNSLSGSIAGCDVTLKLEDQTIEVSLMAIRQLEDEFLQDITSHLENSAAGIKKVSSWSMEKI